MSSDTLRGIGKKTAERDPQDSAAAAGRADLDRKPDAKLRPAQDEPASPKPAVAADKPETRPEARPEAREEARAAGSVAPASTEARPMPLRSLDSTVPGTRSLDASVPGAQPSLDARISRLTPPLSATLIGIPRAMLPVKAAAPAGNAATPTAAPTATPRDPIPGAPGRRDHGTVSGHDVHLPSEMRREAGTHAASRPDPSDGTPLVIVSPALTAENPGPAADSGDVPAARAADDLLALGAHNPWYDQLPGGDDVYEDARPNLVARVAVGAAAAAALAVLVIAGVRVFGHDSDVAPQTAATPPAPARPVTRVASPSPPVAPQPVPAAPVAPIAAAPPPPPIAPPPAMPVPAAPAVAAAPPVAAPVEEKAAAIPTELPPAPRAAPLKPLAVAPTARPEAPHPAVAVRAPGVTPPRVAAPAHPVAAPHPARPATAAQQPATAHRAPAVAVSAPKAAAPHPAPHARTSEAAAGPAKRSPEHSRQKLLADPDSTLPLSLD